MMFDQTVVQMLVRGIGETLYMSLASTIFGYILGIPLGIVLVVSDQDGLRPNRGLYRVIDFIVNIIRSLPFLIALMLLIPVTRFIVGKSYGSTATIVPLVFCAFPFIARLVESSLKEVDAGVVEAAKSMGASNWDIVTKVLLPEAKTSLIINVTIAFGTIFGYSAMAGVVGGGGLGDIAIRYGYYRYQADIMIVSVVLLVLLVQIFQFVGMKLASKVDKRK